MLHSVPACVSNSRGTGGVQRGTEGSGGAMGIKVLVCPDWWLSQHWAHLSKFIELCTLKG